MLCALTSHVRGLFHVFFISSAGGSNASGQVETVVFSERVLKINKRGKEQERDLIVTSRAVYNFVPKEYGEFQRCIQLSQVSGVVLSRNSDEVVVQVTSDYDYHFRVVRRAELAEVIDKYHEKATGLSLPPLIVVRSCSGCALLVYADAHLFNDNRLFSTCLHLWLSLSLSLCLTLRCRMMPN